MTTTTQTIYHSTTLVLVTCHRCGICYGMNERHYKAAQADHELGFYCVGCGVSTVFLGMTPLERKEHELEQARSATARWRAEAATETRRARAFKGQATKLRKKAQAGVCIVAGCTRTFTNQARHMQTEHPDFEPDPSE